VHDEAIQRKYSFDPRRLLCNGSLSNSLSRRGNWLSSRDT
jgi:hypothetical protein